MNSRLFTILILALSSFSFSAEEYDHIYLMEFENVKSDFTINNLSKALPDIIIQNYEFRGDLTVEYLSNIEPYIPDNSLKEIDNAIIVNGRFMPHDDDLDIEIELYDLSSWGLLGRKSFYCPIQDMTCIHDAFLIIVEDMLSDYILAEEEGEISPGQNTKKRIVYSRNEQIDNTDMFKESLSINTIEAEFDIDISHNDEHLEEDEEHDDGLISREFDFSSNKKLSKSPVEINTEKLSHILGEFLTNPYHIIIGEMVVGLNKHDRDIIDFTIPIEFSIKQDLIEELLSDIPNQILYNKNGNLSIELSNKNFSFDRGLITKLSTMRYQIIPIYSFLDEYDEIQLLVIDTWEKKYKNLSIGDNVILHTNQYTPLYAIKSDSDNIYFNLDVNTSVINYSFSVPYNTFGDYTKLIIDFMGEDELDQYLNIDWGNE